MKRGLYILLISILFISCSDFQKTLRSEDVAEKYTMATELFEAEKWNKSFRLLPNEEKPTKKALLLGSNKAFKVVLLKTTIGNYHLACIIWN